MFLVVPVKMFRKVTTRKGLGLFVVFGDTSGRGFEVNASEPEERWGQTSTWLVGTSIPVGVVEIPGPRTRRGTRIASSNALYHFCCRPPWAPRGSHDQR